MKMKRTLDILVVHNLIYKQNTSRRPFLWGQQCKTLNKPISRIFPRAGRPEDTPFPCLMSHILGGSNRNTFPLANWDAESGAKAISWLLQRHHWMVSLYLWPKGPSKVTNVSFWSCWSGNPLSTAVGPCSSSMQSHVSCILHVDWTYFREFSVTDSVLSTFWVRWLQAGRSSRSGGRCIHVVNFFKTCFPLVNNTMPAICRCFIQTWAICKGWRPIPICAARVFSLGRRLS